MRRQNDLCRWSGKDRLGRGVREMSHDSPLELWVRKISVLKRVVKQDKCYCVV